MRSHEYSSRGMRQCLLGGQCRTCSSSSYSLASLFATPMNSHERPVNLRNWRLRQDAPQASIAAYPPAVSRSLTTVHIHVVVACELQHVSYTMVLKRCAQGFKQQSKICAATVCRASPHNPHIELACQSSPADMRTRMVRLCANSYQGLLVASQSSEGGGPHL